MSGGLDYVVVWAGIIAFAVLAYVIMDGFDLGIGILFHCLDPGEERDLAMNSVAPVWDGNETWLVMGGGGLLAAFPLAYAMILPATYPLVIAMLLGLVFRGVAFEFRWRDAAHQRAWDAAFTLGSLLAALAQGMMLGAIVQGIHVEDRAYAGGRLDWLSPFSVLTAVALTAGYALLGATWLVGKTSGALQKHARRLARRAGVVTLVLLVAVSAVTPLLDLDYWRSWFTMPGVLLAAQAPVLTAVLAAALFLGLHRRLDWLPFLAALGLFVLGFAGLAISLFPHVVPPSVTIWDAAAPAASLRFMFAGAIFIVPVILAYTGWSYWVFRGKVAAHGYH